jgi:hypothetical protein
MVGLGNDTTMVRSWRLTVAYADFIVAKSIWP